MRALHFAVQIRTSFPHRDPVFMEARDNVNVYVKYRLPRRRFIVHMDIDPFRARSVWGLGERRAARRWPYVVSTAVVFAALAACRQGEREGGSVNPASAPPSTVAVLKTHARRHGRGRRDSVVERAEEQIRAVVARRAEGHGYAGRD